jgi:hypothetical protein
MTNIPDSESPMAPPEDAPSLPLPVAADIQDHLLAACTDLERLQVLLADACHVLMDNFRSASWQLDLKRRRNTERELQSVLEHVQSQLGSAITALQFQDMASQLIQHTSLRLRSCADQLADTLFVDDEDGPAVVNPAPMRPNPVTQSEMNVGSVELF